MKSIASEFQESIQPILRSHCFSCHGEGDEVHGDVDFTELSSNEQINAAYDTWERVVELIIDGSMPPEDQPKLLDIEKERIQDWFQREFIDAVEAHPGFFRPRRLSAHEYRNTLHSVLGFPLEVTVMKAEQTVSEDSLVMKLLPTDPPGPSGFTNDTSANPLSTTILDQYSYLVDIALDELFSQRYRSSLAAYAGPIASEWLTPEQAELVLVRFAARAFRRHVSPDEVRRSLVALAKKREAELHQALKSELKVILMSPTFIYRGLRMPPGPVNTPLHVDDHELAERLSYFLWADMPDDELLELANAGRLHEPVIFDGQIDRMLESPKARNLAEDFGVQWFSLNEIEHVSNNPPVADALRSQPIDFLYYVFTSDVPLMELIDSETTFINMHTAKYYPGDRKQLVPHKKTRGIEVQSLPNQRIRLRDNPNRGGLLTLPGILAMNRGPVLRGTWILERILGEHLPDPPANVGQVAENKRGENLTFRQRFERHRDNATCAVCHDKIDPLGFALQAYDKEGAYFGQSLKKRKATERELVTMEKPDSSGRLPSGEEFDDFGELKKILITSQRDRVIRNIVRQTMAFALCRRLESHDRSAVDLVATKLTQSNGSFRDLVHEIANSLPFQQTVRRGDETRPVTTRTQRDPS
ncbi:MAG: DUF1592 domain-containing protein [Planctomycetota bacterium]